MVNSRSFGTLAASNRRPRVPRAVWDDWSSLAASPTFQPTHTLTTTFPGISANSPGMNFASRRLPQPQYEPHSRTPFTCEHCGLKFFSLKNKLSHQMSYCWRREQDRDEQWREEFKRIRGENKSNDYHNYKNNSGLFPDVFVSSTSKGLPTLNSMDAYKTAFDNYVNKKHQYELATASRNSFKSTEVT